MIDRVISWRAASKDRGLVDLRCGSIRPVVEETVARFLRMVPPDEVQIRCTFESTGAVRHDPGSLEQALLNLLVNAAKYSAAPKRICLQVRDEGPWVIISVEDSGIGIPAGEVRRIFEPFYRVKAAAAKTSGAGLGLAIVHHAAKAHGGHITLDTKEGVGSRFSIFLPVCAAAEGEEDEAREAGSPTTPAGPRETVLVVEDDRSLREALAMNFELRGYRVLAAADGEAGVRLAFDERPDLIVLDLMLPGLDGFEILRPAAREGDRRPGPDPFGPGAGLGQGERLPARRGRLRHETLPAPGVDRPGGGDAAPQSPSARRARHDHLRGGRPRSRRAHGAAGGPGRARSSPRSSTCSTCWPATPGIPSAARPSSTGSGAGASTAPPAPSTTTSSRCARSSRPTRRGPATSRPCARSATGSISDWRVVRGTADAARMPTNHRTSAASSVAVGIGPSLRIATRENSSSS